VFDFAFSCPFHFISFFIFWHPCQPILSKKNVWPYIETFSLFRSPKTHFCLGRYENKENAFSTWAFLLPIQSQLLCIETLKKLTLPVAYESSQH
jgi:hypothetical protein